MSITYRSDIDGLRAVAVLSVIFFHAGIPGFSGGFVGVDIFFVISGFLITAIILKDIDDDQFSIARFYERRIRRIFPLLFPVIVFTMIAGAYILERNDFISFGKSITYTTLFTSNILFWQEARYFDADSMGKPLLHTWSLAVEEQFYIFFPLLLISINKFANKRYFPWLLGIGVISFYLSIYGVFVNQKATFYLMPTRTWELLSGSLLCLGVIPQIQSKVKLNLISILGLGLIILSVALYTETTQFPGIAAFIPVLGSALIIYTGMGKQTFISNCLGSKPINFIGLISFSLYLWHWPLFAFAKYLLLVGNLSALKVTRIISLSFIIAFISYKIIEQPFRGSQPLIPERKRLFAFACILVFVFPIIGTLIQLYPDAIYQSKYNDKLIPSFNDDSLWNQFGNENALDSLSYGKNPSLIGDTSVVPSYAIWGDSHAQSLTVGLSEKGKEYGVSGFNMSHSGTVPLLGMGLFNSRYNGDFYSQDVIFFLKSHPEIKTVIITAFWSELPKLIDVTGEYSFNNSHSVLVRVGLYRTVKKLLDLGRKVVFISDVPPLKGNPGHYIYLSQRLGVAPDYRNISYSITEYQNKNKDVLLVLNELSHQKNVRLIRLDSIFFDEYGISKVVDKNKLLYMDTGHLTTEGSRFIAPVFDEIFKEMANDKRIDLSQYDAK